MGGLLIKPAYEHLTMAEMYSYLKSLFLCSLVKFVHLMALSLSLSLSLCSSSSLSLSLSLSLSSLSLSLSFSRRIRMAVDDQLELSVDSDLHCSSPVVRKAVDLLLDEVHVVPYPYSRDGT